MSIAASTLPFPMLWAVAANEGFSPRPSRRMTSPGDSFQPDERSAQDSHLLRRMAEGDRDALAKLYDRFAKPLYSAAIHILSDPTEAQDVVHDVFIALWDKAALFQAERGSAFSWAVTLTRNRSIDRVRMRRRRADLLEKTLPADLGYDETGGRSSEENAAQGDEAQVIRAAVATLPKDQKRAVELAFFSGLTQQEIAERLQEPLGTVKARIRRGLLKLRDGLANRL